MLSKVRDLVSKLRGSPRSDQAYLFALVAIVLLGIGLRMTGFVGEPIGFWMDEAGWARRLAKLPLLKMAIRPLGFMWLTRLLVDVLGPTEFAYRLLPNITSVGALLLAPYVASRLFASRLARLVVVFLFALHPALIDLAKEFKPYSVEVLVHMVPLAFYLRYRQTGRSGWLYAALTVLPLMLLFAFGAVFVYPGMLLLALWRGWVSRRRALVIAAVVSGIACGGALLGLHALTLNRLKTERNEQYWGKKYDVFYVRGGPRDGCPQSRVSWVLQKYADMAAVPGLRRERWKAPAWIGERIEDLRDLDRYAWVLLHALGVVYLYTRRRREELVLLGLPAVVLLIVNALGRWPAGAFRTNLFLCPYVLPIPVYGLMLLGSARRRRTLAVFALAGALITVPGFAFGFDWHREKATWTRNHRIPEVLELVRAERTRLDGTGRGRPETLLYDDHTANPLDYYLNTHPSSRARHRGYFRTHFRLKKVTNGDAGMKRQIRKCLRRGKQPIWVVISKHSRMKVIRDYAKKAGKIVFERTVGQDHLVLRVSPK